MLAKKLQNQETTNESTLTLCWDIDDLVKQTKYSKTWLEENLLNDPRIRRHQRQAHERGKRIWLAEPTRKALQEIITNEWI